MNTKDFSRTFKDYLPEIQALMNANDVHQEQLIIFYFLIVLNNKSIIYFPRSQITRLLTSESDWPKLHEKSAQLSTSIIDFRDLGLPKFTRHFQALSSAPS